MSVIRPRSEWTATKEGFSYALKPGTVQGVAIHYPGIGDVTAAGRDDAWARQQLRNYRAYHIKVRGWPDIGYNVAISQNGTAWWAAGRKKAAHCASTANPYANAKMFGVLLIIGNNERPSVAMLATLNRVIAEVRAMYAGANLILGHREVYGASTACPGDVVVGLIHDGTIRAGATPGGIGGGMSPVIIPPTAPAYSGAYIEDVQRLLNQLGEDLLVDGDLGPLTRAAVERFQDAAGLVVDGDPGPITLSALRTATTTEEDTMPTTEEIVTALLAAPVATSWGTAPVSQCLRAAAEIEVALTEGGERVRLDDLLARIDAKADTILGTIVPEETPDA